MAIPWSLIMFGLLGVGGVIFVLVMLTRRE